MKTVRYNQTKFKKTLFFSIYSEFIYFVEQKSKSEKNNHLKINSGRHQIIKKRKKNNWTLLLHCLAEEEHKNEKKGSHRFNTS